MQIDQIKVYSFKELEQKLRQVPLKGDPTVRIYEKARILRPALIEPSELLIAQHYVMNPILVNIEEINKQLQEKGISFMDMEGYISFNTLEDPLEWVDLLPPVVEWQPEEKKYLICDGAHRVSLAKMRGRKIKVVRTLDLDPTYPYYAYPNANNWEDVKFVQEPPDKKKNYRDPKNYKFYFRDFNAPFSNVTKKR